MADKKPMTLERWQHRFGITSSIVIILLMLGVPLGYAAIMGVTLDWVALIPLILFAVAIMATFTVGEIIAYTPLLGPGAMYMCYITGNVTNQKLPCAISALNIVGIKPGSDEANSVSMIAVGVSTFVSMVLIIIGLLLFQTLQPVLTQPQFTPVFNNVVPAICGALLGGSIIGNLKSFILPILFAAICVRFTNLSMAAYMLINLGICLIFTIGSYYLKQNKAKKA